MPISVYPGHGAVFTTLAVVDPYTYEQWASAMKDAVATASFQETRALIVDRLGAGPISNDFLEKMLLFGRAHATDLSGCRIAMVVGDDTSFGVGRMAQLRSEFEFPTLAVRPFRTLDAADEWLKRKA